MHSAPHRAAPHRRSGAPLKKQRATPHRVQHAPRRQLVTTSQRRVAPTSASFMNSSTFTLPRRTFAEEAAEPTLPLSRRKSPIWDLRNPYANDEHNPKEQPQIMKFLKPLGLQDFAPKFPNFDAMISTRSPILKNEYGMSVKQRRLLRRKANFYRVGYYYKTGEIYQPKYNIREPVSPIRFHRDETSDDETAMIIPAKEGLYRAHLRYPGSTYQENRLELTYEQDTRIMHGGTILKADRDEANSLLEAAGIDERVGTSEEYTDLIGSDADI